jgi:hypothetical protein
MPQLSPAATIGLWETATCRAPVERALALAAAAEPPSGIDDTARLPLGRRDARLLALHRALSGPVLEATAPCPACAAWAEFAVDADALLRQADGAPPPAPVEVDGFLVDWRPLDSCDLAAAETTGDAGAAERTLLSRCVTVVRSPDGDVEAAALPASVRDALSQSMAEADPLAEVLVNVACPACGSAFVADLDVGAFVWAELHARVQRLLRDVDALARAYGWTESEVLALGERRRTAYLALAREDGR